MASKSEIRQELQEAERLLNQYLEQYGDGHALVGQARARVQQLEYDLSEASD
jgi:hypothetical protein